MKKQKTCTPIIPDSALNAAASLRQPKTNPSPTPSKVPGMNINVTVKFASVVDPYVIRLVTAPLVGPSRRLYWLSTDGGTKGRWVTQKKYASQFATTTQAIEALRVMHANDASYAQVIRVKAKSRHLALSVPSDLAVALKAAGLGYRFSVHREDGEELTANDCHAARALVQFHDDEHGRAPVTDDQIASAVAAASDDGSRTADKVAP